MFWFTDEQVASWSHHMWNGMGYYVALRDGTGVATIAVTAGINQTKEDT